MIVGIGSDLCDITRVAASIERFGQRFIDRCFSAAEQEQAATRVEQAPFYARRYAAKEAMAKALKTGIGEDAFLREIEVLSGPRRCPELRISGRTLETMQALAPAGHTVVAHLTMTDEPPMAQAFVVLEARPDPAQPA